MPEIKGMALARLLRRVSDPPAVVFLSAHPSAAVEAFEVHAVDFLLKPVSAGRLRVALERIVASARRTTNGGGRDENPDVIAVDAPGDKTKRLVRLATISVVRASGDYAYVVCDDGEFVLRTPLSTLEVEWERAGFVRVHRGFLVNLRRATELKSEVNGTANLELDTGTRIPVARRNVAALRRRLTV
jgi:DNA-binding LytR/AlgR family response regulator